MTKQSVESPGFFKRVFAPKLHSVPDIEEIMTPSEIDAARRNNQTATWVRTILSDKMLQMATETILQHYSVYAGLTNIINKDELALTHNVRERLIRLKGPIEETKFGEDYNLIFDGQYMGISLRDQDLVVTDIGTNSGESHDARDSDKLLFAVVAPHDTTQEDFGEIYITYAGAAFINNKLSAMHMLKPELLSALSSRMPSHR